MKGNSLITVVIVIVVAWLGLSFMSCGDSKSDSTDAGQDTGTKAQPTGDAGSQTDAAAGQATDTAPERPDFTPPENTGEGEVDAGEMTCFMTEPCGDTIDFERHVCPFPLTPAVDGNLDDPVWQAAYWGSMDYTAGPSAPDSDADGSYEFACVADYDNIYFAFRVRDDVIYTGDVTGCDVWGDDSIEFYIDGCYERANRYDGDDAQITIGAENIGVTDQAAIVIGGCAGPFNGADTGAIVHAVEAEGGWMGEIAIPMRPEGDQGWNLEPVHGQVIGFNTHYNDDDEGGDRDHKLIWSMKDRYDDASWQDPQMFGELQFCRVGEPDTAPAGDGGVGDDAGTDTTPDGGAVSADSGM